jgi:hypothetical protein
LTRGSIPSTLDAMVALRRARWLGAVLIAPVLAFAFAASGYWALRCTMTGVLMADAGCPPTATGQTPERAGEQVSVGDPACCERLVVATGKIPGALSERSRECPVATLALAAPSVPTLDPHARRVRELARRVAQPPSFAPPRFLLTHSFLI